MKKQISIILVILLGLAGVYWWKTMNKPADSAPQEKEVGQEQPEEQANANFNFSANGPVGTANGSSGKYLTDKNGFTLYVSVKDENPSGKITQSCDAQCEKTWSPYLLGEDEVAITGSTDPVLSKLNLFKRADGREQYTLGTQPLYRNINDLKQGDIKGDVSGNWMVAKP